MAALRLYAQPRLALLHARRERTMQACMRPAGAGLPPGQRKGACRRCLCLWERRIPWLQGTAFTGILTQACHQLSLGPQCSRLWHALMPCAHLQQLASGRVHDLCCVMASRAQVTFGCACIVLPVVLCYVTCGGHSLANGTVPGITLVFRALPPTARLRGVHAQAQHCTSLLHFHDFSVLSFPWQQDGAPGSSARCWYSPGAPGSSPAVATSARHPPTWI